MSHRVKSATIPIGTISYDGRDRRDCTIRIGRYPVNDAPALLIHSEGEQLAVVTVNSIDRPRYGPTVWATDYGRASELVDELEALSWIRRTQHRLDENTREIRLLGRLAKLAALKTHYWSIT